MTLKSSSWFVSLFVRCSFFARNQKLRFEPFELNFGDSEEFFLEIEGQEIDSIPCVRVVREVVFENITRVNLTSLI